MMENSASCSDSRNLLFFVEKGRAMDPLHWLTMDECGPARLHSGSKAEDAVYKGPLRRHVMPGHGTHLSLGQHRHRLHPGQGPSSRPEALEPEHRPCLAFDAAMILLDS